MGLSGKTLARRRRIIVIGIIALIVIGWALWTDRQQLQHMPAMPTIAANSQLASAALSRLPVKGRAPKTGYSREQFAADWAKDGSCDTREAILARDLQQVVYRADDGCTVLSGTLNDPYTGKMIRFTRGISTSSAVQIDHVVALGDAWQKGAQQLTPALRAQLYNDPLELLAVDGPANEQKSNADAATWLPPNKAYRCRYVARQIDVKLRYNLWVSPAEHDAMQRILDTCPTQLLPVTQ